MKDQKILKLMFEEELSEEKNTIEDVQLYPYELYMDSKVENGEQFYAYYKNLHKKIGPS